LADTAELYRGVSGESYYRHRKMRRSPEAQRRQAALFARHIKPSDAVLDFGCGTGGILSEIECERRIGIEINEPSIADARRAGIEVFHDLQQIPAEQVDVAITNHAIEHVNEPYAIISELFRVLRPNGKLVVVVPFELPCIRRFRGWSRCPDVHLYSWNPRSLGNLIDACGFEVRESFILPVGYSRFNAWLSPLPLALGAAEWIFAHMLGRFGTVCVAQKPRSPSNDRG
jgi:SAM-dependent methyltransferase